MSAIPSPETYNPHFAVEQHINALHELLPNLHEPVSGALNYALMISEHPELDEVFCQQAGKVVHIIARLTEKVGERVTLRGNQGPLAWDHDHGANPLQEFPDLYERTFTFHVPPEHADSELQFKFCVPENIQGKMLWSTGDNWQVDLRQHGHIVKIQVNGVAFA
jgi:hypothetical protein